MTLLADVQDATCAECHRPAKVATHLWSDDSGDLQKQEITGVYCGYHIRKYRGRAFTLGIHPIVMHMSIRWES